METQTRIQKLIPGFKFNLGFSGKYFHHGTYEENLGDDLILGKDLILIVFNNTISSIIFANIFNIFLFTVEHIQNFTWFSHMWNHQQPHLYQNQTLLETDMYLNKKFATVRNFKYNLTQKFKN